MNLPDIKVLETSGRKEGPAPSAALRGPGSGSDVLFELLHFQKGAISLHSHLLHCLELKADKAILCHPEQNEGNQRIFP